MPTPANSLPECLRWTSDPDRREDMARDLPQQLFPQLQHCLEPLNAPPPEMLWAAWHLRPMALMSLAMMEVTDETMTSWIRAYEVAWKMRDDWNDPDSPRTTDAENLVQRPYIHACANLLLGHMGQTSRSTVPISTVDGLRTGRIQFLCLDKCAGAMALYPHPQFAWQGGQFSATFLAGLAAAWQLAEGDGASPSQIFWHITEADGSPVKSTEQTGSSASAAALRAFWHLRRDQLLDEDVYALASCAAGDGTIQDVGDLAAKLSAIQQHCDSLKQKAPATIVVAAMAKNRFPQDDTAIAHASTWAEVKTVATMTELIAVRSCTASAVIAYMEHLAEKLDETPWTRNGKPVRLSDVHVPPRVWRDEYSSHSAGEEEPGSGEREGRTAECDTARAVHEITPDLKQDRRKVLVPWKKAFQRPQYQHIVIVGAPGFGKTSLLRWTAREILLESLAALHARTKIWSEVCWPIITDLAAWLSKGGDSHDALRHAALDFAPLPKTHPKLQREALLRAVEMRLITHTAQTHLFLDALDQVPADKLRLLRGRLVGLGSIAPRLVFSTREAALTTHLPILALPRLTILETAALSPEDARALTAKCLEAKLATRLEAHLRGVPAMSEVAESPLLLTLVCGIVARNPNSELPETAAYLYRDVIQSLARGEWRDTGTATDIVHDPAALLARLCRMAWRLFDRETGTNRFSRDTLIRALDDERSSVDAQSDAALNQLCRLGFLEDFGHTQGEPHYEFRHTTILEFLAASHFAAEINAEGWSQAQVAHWHSENGWQPLNARQILDTHALEPAWKWFFEFAAGLMQQPKPLFEMLADRTKDDIFRHRLHLFCRCYGALAADKEDVLQDLVDSAILMIEQVGRTARRRSPERWRRWIVSSSHFLNLPRAGSQIIRFFTQPDNPTSTSGHHLSLLLLSDIGQNMRCRAGIDALMAICENDDVSVEDCKDAASEVVAIAERLGLPDPIRRLERAMDIATDKLGIQQMLAQALLRVSDDRIVRKAFGYLSAFAGDDPPNEWSVMALFETINTSVETQGAAVIESCPIAAECSLGFEIAKELYGTARGAQDKTKSEIQRILHQICARPDRSFSLQPERLFTLLINTDDITAQELGTKLVLRRLRYECNNYRRIVAAKVLLEHGGNSEREEARSTLTGMAKAPIGNGEYRMPAIRALLETGHPYNDEVRQWLREVGATQGVEDGCIVEAAKITQERNDTLLLDTLIPRLREMLKCHESDEFPRVAKLFVGAAEWQSLERNAFARLRGNSKEDKEHSFSMDVVCFGTKSSALVELLEELLAIWKGNFHPWLPLARELSDRGWRVQISRRKLVILRRGQEEALADAKFGYWTSGRHKEQIVRMPRRRPDAYDALLAQWKCTARSAPLVDTTDDASRLQMEFGYSSNSLSSPASLEPSQQAKV